MRETRCLGESASTQKPHNDRRVKRKGGPLTLGERGFASLSRERSQSRQGNLVHRKTQNLTFGVVELGRSRIISKKGEKRVGAEEVMVKAKKKR